jgi:hypothetical protein
MEHKNLAVMSFDGIHLLLPQQNVATIEVANSIADEVDIPGALGTLKSGARVWPVFALTADFKIQYERPSSYRFCVGFNHDDQEAFSLACEEVSTLSVDNLDQFKPLHACMQTLGCPLESLLLKDNKMMLVSDIEIMSQFLMPGIFVPEVAQA